MRAAHSPRDSTAKFQKTVAEFRDFAAEFLRSTALSENSAAFPVSRIGHDGVFFLPRLRIPMVFRTFASVKFTLIDYKMKPNCHNVFRTVLAAAIALAGMATQTAAAQVAGQPVCCHITGEIIDDPKCHRLLLTKYNADLRVNSCDTIEVDAEGRFTYDLRTGECDMYTIVAENEYVCGRWYSTDFFAENGTVNIRRYAFSTNRPPEMTADGPLNSEMLQMKEKKMELFFNGPEKELRMLEESGRHLTPEAQRLAKLMA